MPDIIDEIKDEVEEIEDAVEEIEDAVEEAVEAVEEAVEEIKEGDNSWQGEVINRLQRIESKLTTVETEVAQIEETAPEPEVEPEGDADVLEVVAQEPPQTTRSKAAQRRRGRTHRL